LSPQLITATPDWGAFDKDQLETIWATIEAPKEHKAPLPAAVRPTWDAFKNLGDSSVNVPTVTQPDQSGINLYGDVDYFDAMAFTRMSPFASFFDGGGTSFGG
jgi:hypothetical protein